MTRQRLFRVVIGLCFVLLVGGAILWLARKPLADAAIRRAIDARGVQASYSVKSIGLQWERIENVRIGDPKSPDLTADWAEIGVTAGFGGAGLRAVRAGGVRLRGRIVEGQLSFGTIDKQIGRAHV